MPPRIRCSWVTEEPFYVAYHDEEWGVPVHDDLLLFEMLILEGAQAGLSWKTILKRRQAYKQAFHHFDPVKVAAMTNLELEAQMHNSEIIRNRLKIFGTRKNAQIFIEIQKEFGSFDHYLWAFVGEIPQMTLWSSIREAPTKTPISDALSKDLKKRGMTFVGSTTLYAFMQAVGLVQDHEASCWKARA